MDEDRGPHPQPPGDSVRERERPLPPGDVRDPGKRGPPGDVPDFGKPEPPGDVRDRAKPEPPGDARDRGRREAPDGGGDPDPEPAASDAAPASDLAGPFRNAARRPDPEPVEDNITWLIYLAIGLIVFLALVVLSGMHSAMGH